MSQARYDHSVAGLGEANFEKLRTCKVLVVGAGGIGCELLKNLVLVGCEKLTVVDLDTIDVSNLNRQFLFRPWHIKKHKAETAAEAAREMNPKMVVDARLDRVGAETEGFLAEAGLEGELVAPADHWEAEQEILAGRLDVAHGRGGRQRRTPLHAPRLQHPCPQRFPMFELTVLR